MQRRVYISIDEDIDIRFPNKLVRIGGRRGLRAAKNKYNKLNNLYSIVGYEIFTGYWLGDRCELILMPYGVEYKHRYNERATKTVLY